LAGKLRLLSGLILFIFVLGHFSNHALGIISLKVMNDALSYTISPWRTLPGTVLLLGALTTHAVLATWSLYKRRSFRMKIWEYLQLILGFTIPIFLAAHVLATRGFYEVYDIEKSYNFHLFGLWVGAPDDGIALGFGLLIVWIHACLGWHYWLRLKPWYQSVKPVALAFAVLVPTLALAGYISAGVNVLERSTDQDWVARLFHNLKIDGSILQNFVDSNERLIQFSLVSLILIILVIHALRSLIRMQKHSSGEKLNYRSLDLNTSRQLSLVPNISVLDQIRNANIPHASVCGGRGRCSTCRIRIDSGLESLPPPSAEESRVLSRISAAPNVRLACQLRANKALDITAMLNPDAAAREGFANPQREDGNEQEIAILFADIRAFTKLSESKLPYDVSFLLNRYFAAMGKAIEQSGGHLDKFIGDGVMALFGLNKTIEEGCADAIRATQKMSEKLEELNQTLANDLDEPLRIGIGVHCGTAIVGRMGYKETSSLTAIGDVVNTASRLESLTKELGAQTIISEKTVLASRTNLEDAEKQEVSIRGRQEPLTVYVIR